MAAEAWIPGVAAFNAARTLLDKDATPFEKGLAAVQLVTSVVPPLSAGIKAIGTGIKVAREARQLARAIKVAGEAEDLAKAGAAAIGALKKTAQAEATGADGLMALGDLKAAKGIAAEEKVFHHTVEAAAKSIERNGLRPGAYATPTGGLSPLQAHIELALDPSKGARNAIVEIDLRGLKAAGYKIPSVNRISSQFGMPGGGYEMQFPYAIPPQFIKVISQ
jgi:hypothetical protein